MLLVLAIPFPWVNEVENIWLNLAVSAIIISVILTVAISAKAFQKVLMTIAVVVLNTACELITLLFTYMLLGEAVGEIKHNDMQNIVYNTISMLVFFTITCLIRAFASRRGKQEKAVYLASNTRVLALLLITIALGYYILTSSKLGLDSSLLMIGISIFILLIAVDVAMLFGTERDIKRHEIIKNMEAMRLQEELNSRIIKQQQDNLDLLSHKTHDYKSQLVTIENMIHMNRNTRDLSDAESYVGSVILELNHTLESQFNGVVSQALRAILCRAESDCQAFGIDFLTDISFSDFSFMKFNDICSFFANALDNAIQACKQIDKGEKSITVNIHRSNHSAAVQIINTNATDVIQTPHGFLSQKQAGDFRLGIGTKNMEKCIISYSGNLNMEFEAGMFTVTAVIPIPS